MAVSGLSFRNNLVGSGWATAILLCMNRLRNCPLGLQGIHFQWGSFFSVWASVCRLSAVTIASLLMGGCGLSHKCVEGGCKSTCVKFGG